MSEKDSFGNFALVNKQESALVNKRGVNQEDIGIAQAECDF